MHIKLLEYEIYLEKDQISSRTVLESIADLVQKSDFLFSHMEINGKEFVGEISEYLNENITSIEKIEIFVKSYESAISQTMSDAINFLTTIQPEIRLIANQFYQGSTEDTWTSLEKLLENAEWLSELLILITKNNTWPDQKETITGLIHDFNEDLLQLNQALVNHDPILIADILGYEFIPLFQRMAECFMIMITCGESQ